MSKRKYPSKEAIHEAAHAVFSVLAGVGVSRLTPQQSIKNVSMYTLYEQAQEAFLAQTTDQFQECGEPDHGAIVQILGYYANAVLAGPFFEHTLLKPDRIPVWFCFTDTELSNPIDRLGWHLRIAGLDGVGIGYADLTTPQEDGDYAKLVGAFLSIGLRATTIFDTSTMPREEAALRMIDWCLTDHPQYSSYMDIEKTAASILMVARLLEETGELTGDNPDFFDAMLPAFPVNRFGMVEPGPYFIPIAKGEMCSRYLDPSDVGKDSFTEYAFTKYMYMGKLPDRDKTEVLRISLAWSRVLRDTSENHGCFVKKANEWAKQYRVSWHQRAANPEICRDLELSLMVGRKTG
jgi:hypothetical protein